MLLLGPLLHLTGEAFVPMVGGDRIGRRPVDFHVQTLEALGAEVEVTNEGISARCSRLRGAIIELPYPSVGATESALLSAALAEGKTVIRNAADRTRGARARPVPPAHGRQDRAVPRPACRHRRRPDACEVPTHACRVTATRPSPT